MSIRTRIAGWILKDAQPGTRLIATWGPTAAGVPVTEDSAMRLAAVNACVRVLSEDVASLPEHIYRRGRDGGKKRARDHHLYRLLHDQPNPEMTAFDFKEALMVNVLLSGNAYAFIEFNRAGGVLAMWPLSSGAVEPYRTDAGALMYRVAGWRDVAPEEMLHVKGLSYDGLKGLSPIAYAREAIGLSRAAEEFGGRFFGNGTHLGGVIETDASLSEEAYERLKTGFAAAYKGLQNSHGVPILEEGAKFKPLGLSQQDAQFLDTRKYQRSEIAAIFRVPPHMIGDLERATFSNIEHQSIEYLQRSLLPWLTRIEQEQRRKLLTPEEQREYVIEHDTGNFLRGDTVSRMQAYAMAVQGGIMTQNECRERENLNPMEGGNELLRPLNLAPAGAETGERSFFRGAERRSAGMEEIAARFGADLRAMNELRRATGEWLKRQAEDIRKLLENERSAKRAFQGREQRRKYSAQHLMNSLNSYYRQNAENGPEALEKAVEAGEFPGWQSMTDALSGMARQAWDGVKGELGDEAADIDEKWMRGFVRQYHSDMGFRLATANLNELTRAMEGAEGQDAIDALEGILERWREGDKADGMAANEVALCVNEARIAAYRKAGYTSEWVSGANCCQACTRLNGRTVSSIKPPLHKGCTCQVRKGEKLDTRTPWDDESMLDNQERLREWAMSPVCQKRIKLQAQARHVKGSKEYERYVKRFKERGNNGFPSYLTDQLASPGTDEKKRPFAELQKLVYEYAGTGTIRCLPNGKSIKVREYVDMPVDLGYTFIGEIGKEKLTRRAEIIYAKDGVHVVPVKEKSK